MQTAQVLVVNHSLYFADLALRIAGASYLPAHRVVVFDEAHHLERTATEPCDKGRAGSFCGQGERPEGGTSQAEAGQAEAQAEAGQAEAGQAKVQPTPTPSSASAEFGVAQGDDDEAQVIELF